MVVHGAKGYVGGSPVGTHGQVAVVLVDAGFDPGAVARALGELFGLTITDHEALEDATPLVLLQATDRLKAEHVSRRIRAAGGFVEMRVPRDKHVGLDLRARRLRRRAA